MISLSRIFIFGLLVSCLAFCGKPNNDVGQAPGQLNEYLYAVPELAGWESKSPLNETALESGVLELQKLHDIKILIVQQGKAVLWYGKPDTICIPAANPIVYSSLNTFISPGQYNTLPGASQVIELTADEAKLTYRNFDLLCRKELNLSLSLAAEKILFEPLRLDSYQWNDSTFCSSLLDFGKFARLWTNRGLIGSNYIIEPEQLEREWSAAYNQANHGKERNGWQYLYIKSKGRQQPIMYWSANGLHVYFLPELRAMIYIFSHHSDASSLWPIVQDKLAASLLAG